MVGGICPPFLRAETGDWFLHPQRALRVRQLGVEMIKLGAQMAVEEAKEKFAAKGVTLEFVPQDDQATPDVGVAVAAQVLTPPPSVQLPRTAEPSKTVTAPVADVGSTRVVSASVWP